MTEVWICDVAEVREAVGKVSGEATAPVAAVGEGTLRWDEARLAERGECKQYT